MCNKGNWRAIDTYELDEGQPVKREGRLVLEECTECFDYRERRLEEIREEM